jgi:formylglycine-generating enzyme required for sulfatase activity
MGPQGVPASTLIARLQTERDVSIRRALILALGEYTEKDLAAKVRAPLVKKLLGWYRNDPDPGIHGAIDWLLRHGKEGPAARPLDWAQAKALQHIDEELASRLRAERFAAVAGSVAAPPLLPAALLQPDAQARGNWYVNGQGQTLTVLDARKPFLMGSPPDEEGRIAENEKLHWRQIGRRYAIGTKPVMVAQFQRFLKACPEVKHSYTEKYSPDADGPIIQVTWYEAAQYCRWLSEQEGIPENEMVYPSVAEIEKCKDGVTPLRLPANHLKRTGYRLPTEAEWEFAARAGAKTSRCYGSSVDLLPRYGWYQNNAKVRSWPVGQQKPNDFGLFDMHGNVWNWCLGRPWLYLNGTQGRPLPDTAELEPVTDRLSRALRGGSFGNRATFVHSANRGNYQPAVRFVYNGLRVCRTYH